MLITLLGTGGCRAMQAYESLGRIIFASSPPCGTDSIDEERYCRCKFQQLSSLPCIGSNMRCRERNM